MRGSLYGQIKTPLTDTCHPCVGARPGLGRNNIYIYIGDPHCWRYPDWNLLKWSIHPTPLKYVAYTKMHLKNLFEKKIDWYIVCARAYGGWLSNSTNRYLFTCQRNASFKTVFSWKRPKRAPAPSWGRSLGHQVGLKDVSAACVLLLMASSAQWARKVNCRI